jgi:peptidoglycan-associated lipoprotein
MPWPWRASRDETPAWESNMKTARFAKQICSLLISAFLAACAVEQTKEQPQPAPAPVAAPAPKQAAAPRRVQQQPAVPENPLHDPANVLSKGSVYYAYDKYDVAAEYRPLVEAHAKYLREHPGATVTVQGNCDERGSREYNLALGQRRAESVTKMMGLLGVPERQMEAVSFGEEKPKAAGHDEAAWTQNRRSDIVYGREK